MEWNLTTIKALREMGAAAIKVDASGTFSVEFYAVPSVVENVKLENDDARRDLMAQMSKDEQEKLANWSV